MTTVGSARCIVGMGIGTRAQKVYFDSYSGGGGTQWGLTTCQITNTIKYKFVSDTKVVFCCGDVFCGMSGPFMVTFRG